MRPDLGQWQQPTGGGESPSCHELTYQAPVPPGAARCASLAPSMAPVEVEQLAARPLGWGSTDVELLAAGS